MALLRTAAGAGRALGLKSEGDILKNMPCCLVSNFYDSVTFYGSTSCADRRRRPEGRRVRSNKAPSLLRFILSNASISTRKKRGRTDLRHASGTSFKFVIFKRYSSEKIIAGSVCVSRVAIKQSPDEVRALLSPRRSANGAYFLFILSSSQPAPRRSPRGFDSFRHALAAADRADHHQVSEDL